MAQIVLTGASLTVDDVARFTSGDVRVSVDPASLDDAEAAWKLQREAIARRAVYGRTTGVGANKSVITEGTADDSLRLMRSHAGGVGDLMQPGLVRAMLLVRLNQLAAGRSGVHPKLLVAVADALNSNSLPAVHRIGAIGTGDLTALAETALTLAGERPWATGGLAPVEFGVGEALGFQSSNAATLAEAVLVAVELRQLLRASHTVAALSYIALGGSPEPYATSVHEAKPHPGQVECAAVMRRLLGMTEVPKPGRRIQDPYGLRAFPQVQGPALDAVEYLEKVLTTEINASTENPMISVQDNDVYHNAHFHTAYVAVALDTARATVHHVAELAAARLGDLVEPDQTDLPAFLASGPAGSSGVMILEYVAHDALAQLRQAALPVTLGSAIVSRGLEDHASFSTQAARQAGQVAAAYRIVLGCELVAAVRALRMRAADLVDVPVRAAYDHMDAILDPRMDDRSLTEDVERASAALSQLAELE
ncbi:aromatic amino acid ammonia-lyase [Kibdelosporangium phytohabitans]|uniref:Histidine ammonia-lyase n=1 Tax=Kibdelosporangium phytohabitans TaxID=860235 RepID=A0A0N9I8X0_9PSEU|nr:aromatic amino acid ammonia-lyase [Kibdelosporangium phytohabitans]ALG12780.1 histidine ammonia-lyase [Kibdelosporangium phytohabitans]MBE1464457.1 histidine ammonia-lyase [Kibdelosporangium phytohabitans]